MPKWGLALLIIGVALLVVDTVMLGYVFLVVHQAVSELNSISSFFGG